MTFTKDFVTDKNGDLYPVTERCGSFSERVENGKYFFRAESEGAFCERLLGSHFPYATYEIFCDASKGKSGFSFSFGDGKAQILFSKSEGKLDIFFYENGEKKGEACTDYAPGLLYAFVTSRGKFFDIYIMKENFLSFVCTFEAKSFSDVCRETKLENAIAALHCEGDAEVWFAKSSIDCGISQADIRPILYENGEVMLEDGKIYLTGTVRNEAGSFQGVFSWIPGTAELALCGAIFYNAGDGVLCPDVAASVKYDRNRKTWLLWVCSFSHGHILGNAELSGDVRFGVSIVDIDLMKKSETDTTDFLGVEGDEDPDFLYDEKRGKWLMTVCRLYGSGEDRGYRYTLFESEKPLSDYHFLARAESGCETGGTLFKAADGVKFICGNSFTERADYRVYDLPAFGKPKNLRFDYDDGGFRGWGTLIKVPKGTREALYHITFDRHNGSDSYKWSYGNVYCFEADAETRAEFGIVR